MGFYIELVPHHRDAPTDVLFFKEGNIPPFFWTFYLIAGFALVCMGLSASSFLMEMARSAHPFDRGIAYGVLLFVLFYIGVGCRFLFVRKFISASWDQLQVGYLLKNRVIFRRIFLKENIKKIQLVNVSRGPNVILREGSDDHYGIQGHYRILMTSPKNYTVDRHTEREALEPLYGALWMWFNASSSLTGRVPRVPLKKDFAGEAVPLPPQTL